MSFDDFYMTIWEQENERKKEPQIPRLGVSWIQNAYMGADASLPPSTCGISKLPNPEQNRGVKTSTMVVVFYSVVE